MPLTRRPYDRYKATDLSSLKWTNLYTRGRVAALRKEALLK